MTFCQIESSFSFPRAKPPTYTAWRQVPDGLKTKRQWTERGRQLLNQPTPSAILKWENEDYEACQTKLYAEDQTRETRLRPSSEAALLYFQLFTATTSKSKYLWWNDDGWQTCAQRFTHGQAKNHIAGSQAYGVFGGYETTFGAIDLDLHNGDPDVFLSQFKVLLNEFHGHDGWHYQVSESHARGVHLIQAFFERRPLADYRARLRARLKRLDAENPKLAARARAAGMKTLGELEIYPDKNQGFRLPLSAGRTVLIDKPLRMTYEPYRKDYIPDAAYYIAWIHHGKKYMPKKHVFNYVEERLAIPKRKPIPLTTTATTTKTPITPTTIGSLGPMKGRYRQTLVDFWTGTDNPPDTLNTAIRLLALVLPFYIKDEDQAVQLIEQYIDELPDHSFSDRLKAGNRKKVSQVVKSTVRQVYAGFTGQDDPEQSRQKLTATVAAWNKRGFDPTNKTTWSSHDFPQLNKMPAFNWKPAEVQQLSIVAKVLNVDLETASQITKRFISFVKTHPGECPINFVKCILKQFGVKCGHNGKTNAFLKTLHDLKWIYVRVAEQRPWRDEHPRIYRAGRARAYGVGVELIDKFNKSDKCSATLRNGSPAAAPLRTAERFVYDAEATSYLIKLNSPPTHLLYASHYDDLCFPDFDPTLESLITLNKGSPLEPVFT